MHTAWFCRPAGQCLNQSIQCPWQLQMRYPNRSPWSPWLAFRRAQRGRQSVPLLAHLLPSRPWLPSPLCSHFPGRTGESCRLNCFLLEHLRTCQMRSDSKQVLCSAGLIQIKSKYLLRGTWLKYIYFTASPNGPVIRCLRQGYRGADESQLPSPLHRSARLPGWSPQMLHPY